MNAISILAAIPELAYLPEQLAAAIKGHREIIIPDPEAFVVEKLGIFGRPPDLHDPRGDHSDLVVPDA